jgi:hypothetical protein
MRLIKSALVFAGLILDGGDGRGGLARHRHCGDPAARRNPKGTTSTALKNASPTIQHADLERVLDMVIDARKAHAKLNYGKIAIALGRDPVDNARYMGSICDKLDACAALAGVPVLALDVVRTEKGEINLKAMPDKEAAAYRSKIIERAKMHEWTESDFSALRDAAHRLRDHGTRKAWGHVVWQIGSLEAAFRELAGIDPPTYVFKSGNLRLRNPKTE